MLDIGCPKNTVFLANDHNFQMNDSWLINNKDFMQLKSGISSNARLFCENKDETTDNIRANILRCDDVCVC